MERIALVAPRLELRGATVYTLTLARELKQRGYRVTVLAGHGGFAAELVDEKIPHIRTDFSGRLMKDLLYLGHFTRALKQVNPKLIHVTHHELAFIGGLIARRLRVPWVVTLQNPVSRPVPCRDPWFRGAIAISQTVRQSAVNTGRIPREQVHIVENGVSTSLTAVHKEHAGLVPVVGAVDRMEKERGIKYFIHAAQELISRKVKAHFLVIGTGPNEKKIRKLVRRLDLAEHVTINMAGGGSSDLVNAIDIFVTPALTEGFGIFVLQAMAAGLPVVASGAGGGVFVDHGRRDGAHRAQEGRGRLCRQDSAFSRRSRVRRGGRPKRLPLRAAELSAEEDSGRNAEALS